VEFLTSVEILQCVCIKNGRSHFLKIRLRSCSKIFLSGPGREFFKFENPTPVRNLATVDPTEIYPCFFLRNGHADSCYWRNWKWLHTRVLFFTIFWLRVRIRNKNQNPAGVHSDTPDPMCNPIQIMFHFAFFLLALCLKVLMLECLHFSHTTGSLRDDRWMTLQLRCC